MYEGGRGVKIGCNRATYFVHGPIGKVNVRVNVRPNTQEAEEHSLEKRYFREKFRKALNSAREKLGSTNIST